MIMPENYNKNLEQKRGPPSQKIIRFREVKIRVVEFVPKKLLTYFEMLIVPHALQCVDGCFFVFHRIDILLLAY